MPLALESETIGRTGGITGAGAKKVLGAPHIDSLEVVLREAVQNSWDAATNEADGITFGVEAFEFSARSEKALREALSLGGQKRPPVLVLPTDRPLDALLVWDQGTGGLRGPLRADITDQIRSDFVRFVYMIGDTKTSVSSIAKGGTYGFGRSSFLSSSQIGTILVFSNTTHVGRVQSRFIGMSWTDADGQANRTGRHWWGDADGRHVLPLTDRAARRQAEALGMNPIGEDLGTAICILLPRWASSADLDEARAIALKQVEGGLLWNCWPRIVKGSIRTRIRWFGEDIKLPDPAHMPRLRTFVKALNVAETDVEKPATMLRHVELLRPKRRLGKVALAKAPFLPEQALVNVDADDHDVRDASQPLHHVAMMRGTRLVIHYFECAQPQEGEQYAGVFIADREADELLAKSEPPAHDEWVKERLAGTDRRVVSVTYKRVAEVAREYVHPFTATPVVDTQGEDLAALADTLGDLLLGATGDGLGGSDGGGSGGGVGGKAGSRSVLSRIGTPQRVSLDCGQELRFPVAIDTGRAVNVPVRLSARVMVAVDGGIEKTAPTGAMMPRVIGWQRASGGAVEQSDECQLHVIGRATVTLIIYQPADCSVRPSVEIK